jgi:hypothetical protein
VPPYRSPARRVRLAVQPLESRVVLDGTITASLIGGVLSLTGEDLDNDVQIKVDGTGATLTSTNGTQFTLVTPLTGPVTSIKADLKGGADNFSIDPTSNFAVPGPVAIKLGDGNNTLDLVTSGTLTLGGLTYTGGDGSDAVTIAAGAGSTIGGTAKFTYANGGSETNLTGVTYNAVTLVATEGSGAGNNVTADGVTVTKTFSAATGSGFPAVVQFFDSTLGGLKVTGYGNAIILQDTVATGAMQVNGTVFVKGTVYADLHLQGAAVTGGVTVAAPSPSLEADGGGSTINGTLAVTGTIGQTQVTIDTDTLTEIKGNITVKGGPIGDVFTTTALFKADKNVILTLNGGDNLVALGDGSGVATVVGGVTVKTGAGNDQVVFDQVSVTGPVLVTTLGGADTLAIDDETAFQGAFTADLGAGDDTILIAQNPGRANPVRFVGKATIKGGAGNDLLALGLADDPLVGGDGNSQVQFTVPTSLVDGGLGVDTLDPDGQFTPATVIVNWA